MWKMVFNNYYYYLFYLKKCGGDLHSASWSPLGELLCYNYSYKSFGAVALYQNAIRVLFWTGPIKHIIIHMNGCCPSEGWTNNPNEYFEVGMNTFARHCSLAHCCKLTAMLRLCFYLCLQFLFLKIFLFFYVISPGQARVGSNAIGLGKPQLRAHPQRPGGTSCKPHKPDWLPLPP